MLKIPEELSGQTKKLVKVGKDQKYFVDPKDKRAVKELKKQLSLYSSFKKSTLTKMFPLLWRFMPFELVNTSASLIYQGTNLKLFDFDKRSVTTVFKDKENLANNVKWIKKLDPLTAVPEIISQNPKKNLLTTKYYDFELLDLEKFIIYIKEIIEINNFLGKTKKQIRLSDFLKTLPADQKELITKRAKELEIEEKTLTVTHSHGDFHPGNLPRHGVRFYLLDFDSVAFRPKIFDFASFSFIPAHFNMKYAETGVKLFKKFLGRLDPSSLELVASLSLIRNNDTKLQNLFEENNMFIDV